MGFHQNIDHDKFPKQSNCVGGEVDIIYHYDTSRKFKGIIIRDDTESPWETIFKVGDRIVRANECQHTMPMPKK